MDTTTFILVAILYYIVTVGILILVLNLISSTSFIKKKLSTEKAYFQIFNKCISFTNHI